MVERRRTTKKEERRTSSTRNLLQTNRRKKEGRMDEGRCACQKDQITTRSSPFPDKFSGVEVSLNNMAIRMPNPPPTPTPYCHCLLLSLYTLCYHISTLYMYTLCDISSYSYLPYISILLVASVQRVIEKISATMTPLSSSTPGRLTFCMRPLFLHHVRSVGTLHEGTLADERVTWSYWKVPRLKKAR